MKTPVISNLEKVRDALDRLNYRRGKGSIKAVRLFLDGTGEADRKGQYFADTIKFKTLWNGENVRVFALGSSQKWDPLF